MTLWHIAAQAEAAVFSKPNKIIFLLNERNSK